MPYQFGEPTKKKSTSNFVENKLFKVARARGADRRKAPGLAQCGLGGGHYLVHVFRKGGLVHPGPGQGALAVVLSAGRNGNDLGARSRKNPRAIGISKRLPLSHPDWQALVHHGEPLQVGVGVLLDFALENGHSGRPKHAVPEVKRSE